MACAAFDAGNGGRVGEDEIADEQAERAHDEDGRGEEGIDAAGAEHKPHQRHQPVERIDELAEEGAADEQMELQTVPEAETLVETDKVPCMNEIGLNIAFHPTGALFDPEKEIRAGLLPCGGFENARPPTAREEPQAEIAVFRHIVFIPSADFAQDIQPEVVGCSAKRDGSLQAVEPRQAEPEPCRIVRRETFRQKILVWIVEAELGLDAGDFLRASCKSVGGLFQLVWFGLVFRVVDDKIVRVTVFDGDVAGLWFRARIGFRNRLDDERRLEVERFRDAHGFVVVLFDEQADFKSVFRIVELGEAIDEMREDVAFMVHGQDDHVARPLPAVWRRGELFWCQLDFARLLEGKLDDEHAVKRRK